MAAAAGAAPVPTQSQEQEALFAAKHAELLSEARAVARDHGVSVRVLAFRPDGTAVAHELVGAAREARATGMIARAAARDVSAMGLQEVTAHQRQLHALRALVLRALQAKAAAAAKESAPGQQQEQQVMDMDGGNGAAADAEKITMTD